MSKRFRRQRRWSLALPPDGLDGPTKPGQLATMTESLTAERLKRDRTNRYASEQWLKRLVDLVGASILIVALLPVMVLAGCLVSLEGGWPIIYRRRVVGRKGDFDAYKFRSMCKNADAILAATPALKEEFERNFKLEQDPRVTRVGYLLRKLSLDELPQLFNVLKGEMSLVGPRMISPAELDKYGTFKDLLLAVKPGLTGYWQVNGRQTVGYDERVRMDMYYVKNWSLAMDIKILMKTPYAVLTREGAY